MMSPIKYIACIPDPSETYGRLRRSQSDMETKSNTYIPKWANSPAKYLAPSNSEAEAMERDEVEAFGSGGLRRRKKKTKEKISLRVGISILMFVIFFRKFLMN